MACPKQTNRSARSSRIAVAVTALITLSACLARDHSVRGAAAGEAQADSSAAGLAVGSVVAMGDGSSKAVVPVAAATPRLVTPRTNPPLASAPPDQNRVSSDSGARTPMATAQHPTAQFRPPLPVHRKPRVTPLPSSMPMDSLRIDSARRSVRVHLVAGSNGANERLNFNGASHGAHTIEVPVGWRVSIHLTSSDPDLSHSALVIPLIRPIPSDLPGPAFPGAATAALGNGIDEEGDDDLAFIADRAGGYLIVCAVADHARDGQWIRLIVSPSARLPSYR